MTNAQVHPLPEEILRLSDGSVRMTVRVNVRLVSHLSKIVFCNRYRDMIHLQWERGHPALEFRVTDPHSR